MPLLEVRNLCIDFPIAGGGSNRVVDGVDIAVEGGEILGIIGESGSGKSLSMLAVMGLLPGLARVRADRMHFDGRSLLGLTQRQRTRLVGKDIAMIFQEPNTSLNPCFSIGHQIAESIRIHEGRGRAARRERVLELLAKVGIPDPEARFDAFPHQLSGGMNQRAMIAMAISCNPKLLIADEPTTALDVTIQAQILSLLTELQRERQMAMVLVTHDMAVVADTAQRVSVMYSGQLVEDRRAPALFASPAHPYTAALLNSLPENADSDGPLPTIPGTVPGWNERPNGCLFQPRCKHAFSRCRSDAPSPQAIDGDGMERETVRCHAPLASHAQGLPQAKASARIAEPKHPEVDDDVLMEAIDLKRHYVLKTGPWKPPVTLKAVDGVSFRLRKGKTLAVVGESGCGKSTLARMASLLEQPSEGELLVDRKQTDDAAERRGLRSHVQMVFQNPYGSLNPRKTIGATLEEPLAINTRLSRTERVESVRTMMTKVGLRREHFDRYPHMFSGGQRQRIAIARALMLRPRVVVADEPVSALDISIQAQILNLLQSLQGDFGLAYLFISHDLSVVRHLADDLMVMYLGRPVEYGSRDRIFGAPVHPYSRLLLASRPGLGGGRPRILARGELPSPLRPPSGCAFHTRCPAATRRCSDERPEARPIAGRLVACHHAETLAPE